MCQSMNPSKGLKIKGVSLSVLIYEYNIQCSVCTLETPNQILVAKSIEKGTF